MKFYSLGSVVLVIVLGALALPSATKADTLKLPSQNAPESGGSSGQPVDAAESGPARANQLKLTSSVRSGVQSVLAYARRWDRDCHPLPVNVTITNLPLNGVASVKAGLSTLPESTPRSGSTGKCAGGIAIGRQIMYRSNPGFHGLDTVSYEEIDANGNRAPTTITVTVR